ncbi:unnamed protein product [Schistosoma rodhaini]|nr:unnamed protein product [Schistosoma rodhaini]
MTFIQYVDMKQKMVYGFMKIENLTQEYPSLTTYFEGEIISRLHPFMTGKWDATMETDVLHWVFVQLLSVHLQEKIPATSSLGNFHIDSFDYSILETSDTIFMRWKVSRFSIVKIFLGKVHCSGSRFETYRRSVIRWILLYRTTEIYWTCSRLLLSS